MNIIFKVSPRLGVALAQAALAAALVAPLAAQAETVRAAVFPFELYDTSLSGETGGRGAAARARLSVVDTELHDLLAKTGRYQLVSLGPAAEKAAKDEDLRTCDGCEVPLAREAGADVSIVGWVQKVSELILNINLVIRDVKTGKVLQGGSVDIRGDNDESWTRGIDYLVRDRMKLGQGASPAVSAPEGTK